MSLAPDLADDISFRVDRLHPAAKLLPKRIVIDLAGHIQAPAVDPELDSMLGHIPSELAHGRRADVKLRQRRQIPPGLVVGVLAAVRTERPTDDREPVQVGRIRPILQDVVELKKPRLAWLNTPSRITRMPRACAASTSLRSAALPPSSGST